MYEEVIKVLREVYLTAMEYAMIHIVGAFMVNDWFIAIIHAAMIALLWAAIIVLDAVDSDEASDD